MKIQNYNNINFYAIPKSSYKLANGELVNILELEKRDLPFISKLSANIEKYMDNREIETVTDKRLIIDTSFQIIKEMLERFTKIGKNNKTHMYVAECNSDICGVLVGGLPKKVPNAQKKQKILYSSRDGAKETETELNWLATWTPDSNIQRKGVGKVLMGEFIDSFERDGFQEAFIQSEIPALSFAQKFYESLGFSAMLKQIPHSQIEKNKDIVTCVESLYDYEIVPMLGKLKSVNKVKESIFARFNRKAQTMQSVDLNSVANKTFIAL